MYRIRFHGRGGQGMKTAANIVGDALFATGYEVQDAPRFGAERRGAPMFASVRASRRAIVERGTIVTPDLVVVADSSLLGMPAAGVMQGVTDTTWLLVNSTESAQLIREHWRYPGQVASWPATFSPPAPGSAAPTSAACAGAAARMLGMIPREAFERALVAQSASRSAGAVETTRSQGLAAFDAMASFAGCVSEGDDHPAMTLAGPDWVQLSVDDAPIAAPDIYAQATSEQARTGLWRSHRPVIDYEHCNRCSWVCSTLCPDSAIGVDEDRTPRIDYDHCKGCMVCVLVCPAHAIRQVSEQAAQAQEVQP
jgi:pyruvate ferredoxin oxidoreductase gamma subunit